MDRYLRNKSTISEKEQETLALKKVLVIGCGGLGTHVIEGLARIGIMNIGICDYDVYDESNLNRQLNATISTIGNSKVQVTKNRILSINSSINCTVYDCKYPNENLSKVLTSYDLVIDCLDSIKTRKALELECIQKNKPLVYGTIAGFYGYFGVITAKNPLLSIQKSTNDSIEKKLGNPYFIVATVASMQLRLGISVLLDWDYLKQGFYTIDLEDFSIEEISVVSQKK